MSVTRMGNVLLTMMTDARNFQKGMTEAQQTVQHFASTMTVTGVRINAVFAATFGALGLFAGKVGSDFELAMAGVRKTVSATEPQMQAMQEQILGIANRTPFAASELANLARLGGQLGIKAKDVTFFSETIAKLGVAAAELGAEEAAVGLARLIGLTENTAADVERLASTLAFLGDNFETNESRILNFGVRIASLSKIVNISAQDILGISGAFTAVVGGVERSATAVQRAVAEMAKAVDDGGANLELFGKVALGEVEGAGERFKDLFEKDATEALTVFVEGLSKVKEEGGNVFQTLKDLQLGNVRTTQTLLAMAGAGGKLREAVREARREFQQNVKLQKEFDNVMDTVSSQLGVLGNNIKEFGIRLFLQFRDVIMGVIKIAQVFVQGLTKLVSIFSIIPNPVKALMLGLLALIPIFGLLLIGIGQLTSAILTLTVAKVAWTKATAVAATTQGALLASVGATAKAAFASTAAIGLLIAKVALVATVFVAAFKATEKFFSFMLLNTGETTQAVEDAISELSLFQKILGGLSVIKDIFVEGWKAVIDFKDTIFQTSPLLHQVAKAVGAIANQIATTFQGALTGVSVAIENMAKRAFELAREQGNQAQATRQANAAIHTANQLGKEYGLTFNNAAEAQAFLAEQLKKMRPDLTDQNAIMERNNETIKNQAKSLIEQAQMAIEAAEADQKLKDAAKAVGKEVSEMTPQLADAILRQLEMKKAAEEAAKAHRELVGSFREVTKETKAEELEKFTKAFIDSGIKAKDLADDALRQLVEKVREMATAAGKEVPREFQTFEKALAAIDVQAFKTKHTLDQLVHKLLNVAEKIRGKGPDLGKLIGDELSGDASFAPVDPQFDKLIQSGIGGMKVLEEQTLKAAEAARKEARKAFRELGQTITGLNSIFDAFGVSADNLFRILVTGALSAIPAIEQLSNSIKIISEHGLTSGKSGFGGIVAAIGNIGSLFGPIGAIAGFGASLVKKLFGGRGAEDVAEEVGRDMGVSISEGLAKSIHESGQNAQLFIKDIFETTDMSADQLAQEVQDLFSFFERGEITLGTLRTQFGELMPLLVSQFDNMGESGRTNLQAIITFAQELGIEVGDLEDKMMKFNDSMKEAFAPATLEEFMEEFELTNEQARQILDDLEVNFQTNMQRMAASIGVTGEEFKKLKVALEEALGKELDNEEFLAFLEATGLTAQQLGEELGVAVGESQSTKDEIGDTNQELGSAVDLTKRWTQELKNAAAAAASINIPSIPGSVPGGIPGFAQGGIVKAPTVGLIGESQPEVVAPVASLFGEFADVVAAKVAGAGGGMSERDEFILDALDRLPDAVGKAVRDNVQRVR